MKKKGIMLSTNMVGYIIMIVIAVVIIFLLFGEFAAETGSPVSELYFKMFDWIARLLSP